MDSCLPDWNKEFGVEFPIPIQRKTLGLDNDLVELLWQNGEVVLNSQTNRKQSCDPFKLKQIRASDHNNPSTLIQDDEAASWIDCPIDESFEKEFYGSFSSEIPSSNPVDTNNLSGKFDGEKFFKFGAPFAPLPLPQPRFEAFRKTCSPQLPVKKQALGLNGVPECSVMTIGSSHCASNQVDMSWPSSCGIGSRALLSTGLEKNCSQNVSPCSESTDIETLGQAITSCSGGSWKTSSPSNDTNSHKRKSRDMEESECRSDATELESAKSSQKSGATRRSRVAEVHNLSERKRRDRINEKMKALQELIPHSNKSDKASMLDEAIEYMKSLQLQLQLMWMGSGMAPMMLPGMQHYMSRVGMGIAPPMFPAVQNFMPLSRLPLVHHAMNIAPTPNQAPIGHSPVLSPVNYLNQMQNSCFPEQYGNYMGFHSTPITSQPINMFNFGFHSAPQNQIPAPPGNGNGAIG